MEVVRGDGLMDEQGENRALSSGDTQGLPAPRDAWACPDRCFHREKSPSGADISNCTRLVDARGVSQGFGDL
ncbi:unnamed protein product [Arctogadus glacialis]